MYNRGPLSLGYPGGLQAKPSSLGRTGPGPGKEKLCSVLCLGGRSLSTRQDRPVRWRASGSVLGALTILSPTLFPSSATEVPGQLRLEHPGHLCAGHSGLLHWHRHHGHFPQRLRGHGHDQHHGHRVHEHLLLPLRSLGPVPRHQGGMYRRAGKTDGPRGRQGRLLSAQLSPWHRLPSHCP